MRQAQVPDASATLRRMLTSPFVYTPRANNPKEVVKVFGPETAPFWSEAKLMLATFDILGAHLPDTIEESLILLELAS